MALPRKRQMLARHIKYRDTNYATVANATGIKLGRFANLVKGLTFPTPDELDALETFFSLPAETLFDKEMLEYRNDWPPPRGFALMKAELARLREAVGE